MDKFDFVLILLSFAFAMALGHLLTGVGALISARERVRFSPLLALAIVNALAQVFIDWLSLWDYRGLPEWDLLTVSVFFTFPVVVYFICVAAVPETQGDKPIDMEAFYWKTRRLYYGLFALLMLLFAGAAWTLLRTSTPELALQQSLSNLPFLLASLLAFFVSARWAQWLAGVTLLVLSVAWPIVFSSSIQ
ncbi:MAG: hypothetical protein NT015_12475 [Alphaproteobacteria bacterium]|jgi:hypothetical protein|nr:hypothetical protein [Alphaproteobacteria bacterium]